MLREMVEKRKRRIAADKKRYWRVVCGSGKPLVLYVDMVDVILRYGLEYLLLEDHAAGLSVVPVVIIPPGLR